MSLVAIAIFLSAGILTVSIAHFLWNYLRERENKLDKNALDLKIAPGSDTNNPRTLLLINRGKTVRNPEFTAHNQQAIRIDPPEHSKGGPPQQLRVWKTTYPARVRITHLVASESPVKFGFTVCYMGVIQQKDKMSHFGGSLGSLSHSRSSAGSQETRSPVSNPAL